MKKKTPHKYQSTNCTLFILQQSVKFVSLVTFVEHNKRHNDFFHKHNQRVLPNYACFNGKKLANSNPG